MSNLFIKPQYLKMLTDIFDEYCPHAEVWAYGSRLNGRAHDGSDLDLAVVTMGDCDITIWELIEIIRESNIPFLVDMHDYNSLPEYFQTEIKRNYEIIYKK